MDHDTQLQRVTSAYKSTVHASRDVPWSKQYPLLAYFACLTSDVLPHAFPRLSGSNFSMRLQNAADKGIIKKSPLACLKFNV